MKIAIVCQNFPPASFEGGISHYSQKLAKYLSSRGHRVYAITSTEFSKSLNKNFKGKGLEIIYVKGPWSLKSVFSIKKIARDLKLSSIILQYSPASFDWRFRLFWAVTPFPCRKITAFHTLWGGSFDRLLGLLNLCGSHQIIATNSEIITILEKWVPELMEKTFWIPIGSNITPVELTLNRTQETIPVISFFGMMYPGKGLGLILEVLRKLKQKGHQFKFKFIGGGMIDHEFYEIEFQKIVVKKNLHDCIQHLGLISASEASHWLNKSRFVFLPYEKGLSDRRGSFMAVVAHHKAILTSAPIVEMPFLVNNKNVIWPVTPTIDGYLEKVESLISDDKLVRSLEEGVKEISGYFSWEKISEDYEKVIKHNR